MSGSFRHEGDSTPASDCNIDSNQACLSPEVSVEKQINHKKLRKKICLFSGHRVFEIADGGNQQAMQNENQDSSDDYSDGSSLSSQNNMTNESKINKKEVIVIKLPKEYVNYLPSKHDKK